MGFKVVTKAIAYADLDEAISWYENEAPGLGERFFLKVEEAKNRIAERPMSFSYIKKPVRRCMVDKFPYKILFIITGDVVFILGICHTKRSNAFVRRRLKLME